MKFLHIADVHLGCTRYQLAESPRDFFDAWVDVLKRYAIGEKVDFVIMCGDFFHKRSVPPETMNYAVEGLTMMRDAGIPVVTIEGNHDQKHTDSDFSWLRSLSSWGLVKLLEPESKSDAFTRNKDLTHKGVALTYEPWNETSKKGGYIDIGRARIFGSDWYGASGNWAIPMLTEAIKQTRRDGAFHILMLHTDVEGHQMHPIPALSMDALKELKTAVEYVGLGHTHKHYEIDNWAFNPGSIEITNISEFRETRGAFVVEINKQNTVLAHHIEDYRYRPFQQLAFDVTDVQDAKSVTDGVLKKVSKEARVAESDKPQPIIEIALRGQLGFPNSLLEMQKMRDETKALTNALHIRIKNHTVPADYLEANEDSQDEGRERLERRVIEDLIIRDNRYKARAHDISDAVIGAKRMALSDDEPQKIAEFIGLKACQTP
ncbi:MAG: DNA repair exonuclease [Chloracidobacterium sp.]|nr:DNA repair exonuclease [Chloracidobacterium sp.]